MSYSATSNSVIFGNNVIVKAPVFITEFVGAGSGYFDITDPIFLQKGTWLLAGSINIESYSNIDPTISKVGLIVFKNSIQTNQIIFELSTTSFSIPVNVVLTVDSGDEIKIRASATTVGNAGWYILDQQSAYLTFVKIS